MKNTIPFLLFLTVCFAILPSCEKHKLRRQLEKFSAKEISIPQDILQIYKDRDTVMLDTGAAYARLVIYADSLDCSSCKVNRIYHYSDMLSFREESGEGYMPLFIFSPTRRAIPEVRYALKASRFPYPVLLDESGSFAKANPHIPADDRFHTFLLDRNGKVVLVGDPSHNIALWELYKTTITQLIENHGSLPD